MRRWATFAPKPSRIQDATELIAQELTPQLTALDARLKELGPEPAPDAPPESPEVQRERADLTRERGDIDARIKRARLLSVAADQAGDQITAKRRALFDEKLWQRTKSVLVPELLDGSQPEPAARRVAPSGLLERQRHDPSWKSPIRAISPSWAVRWRWRCS